MIFQKFCSFCSSFLCGRLHREKKDWEKKVFVCFHHYIIGPPQREEVLREIKMKRFLNFNYATMKFLIFHKFCSFWSFGVYWRPSSGVDYTTERRKTEREKRKMFYITLHRPTTERRSFVWERKILKFLNYATMNEWMRG